MASPAAPDFSLRPALTGEKVVLRSFATADFPVRLAALADPGVLRLTGSVHGARAGAGPDGTERFPGGLPGSRRPAGPARPGRGRLGRRRTWLEVCAFSPRAQRVDQKARYEDERIDATVMSILDRGWARYRGWPAISAG